MSVPYEDSLKVRAYILASHLDSLAFDQTHLSTKSKGSGFIFEYDSIYQIKRKDTKKQVFAQDPKVDKMYQLYSY